MCETIESDFLITLKDTRGLKSSVSIHQNENHTLCSSIFAVVFLTKVLSYTAWKVSRYGVFSGPYFPVFG